MSHVKQLIEKIKSLSGDESIDYLLYLYDLAVDCYNEFCKAFRQDQNNDGKVPDNNDFDNYLVNEFEKCNIDQVDLNKLEILQELTDEIQGIRSYVWSMIYFNAKQSFTAKNKDTDVVVVLDTVTTFKTNINILDKVTVLNDIQENEKLNPAYQKAWEEFYACVNSLDEHAKKIKDENAQRIAKELVNEIRNLGAEFMTAKGKTAAMTAIFEHKCATALSNADEVLSKHRTPSWLRFTSKFMLAISGVCTIGLTLCLKGAYSYKTTGNFTIFGDKTISSAKVTSINKSVEKVLENYQTEKPEDVESDLLIPLQDMVR